MLRYETGFRHHYIPIPADVAAAYEEAGVRRLAGSISGLAVRRAIQGRQGERVRVIGQNLLREIGAAEGETVIAELRGLQAEDASLLTGRPRMHPPIRTPRR